MFLLLVVLALGGILTAWGITQIPPRPSGSRSQSILRSSAFILSLIVGLLVVAGFLMVSSLKPPETSDTVVAWASHILLILSIVSLSLLLHAICHAPVTERGIASAVTGIILVALGSFPLFHPTFIYPIFRSVFIITPSELLACILFFLVGMSFVFAQQFWTAVRSLFATYLPQHPFYTGIVASLLLVSMVLLATMPPSLTSWMNRVRGFKTPLLEAEFFSSRDSSSRQALFGGKFNNWPNELLVQNDIAGLISILSEQELLGLGKASDLTESMRQLDRHLKSIGYYDYVGTIAEPSTRPHVTEMKRQAGCLAMRLYSGNDHCETTQKGEKPSPATQEGKNESPSTQKVNKQPSPQLSPSKSGQTDTLYEKNPVFYGIVSFLFQFSEDFKKAELVLEAGLQHAEAKNGLHWTGAQALLRYWIGSLIYNRYHELQIKEVDTRALDLFRRAIGNATSVIEAIPVDATAFTKRNPEWIDNWKIFVLQTQTSYVLVAADSLLNEWSARRYAADIKDARSDYLDAFPLFLESVGWAKIRFHKDGQEIRDGKAILVELERVIEENKTENSLRWKVLKTIRNHIAVADLLLETS